MNQREIYLNCEHLLFKGKEERKISRVETRVYAINSNEAEDDSLMLYDYFIAEAHDFVEPWEELNGTCLPGGLFTSFVSYSFTTPAVVKYVMILTCVREGMLYVHF